MFSEGNLQHFSRLVRFIVESANLTPEMSLKGMISAE